MDHLKSIFESIRDGSISNTKTAIEAALAEGIAAEVILKQGMIPAMDEVGRLYEKGTYYVSELLLSARAMQAGVALLKPHLMDGSAEAAGKVVVGTVKGDLHDIGKNLVAMMLRGVGFEVIDLGTNATPEKFVKAVKEHQPALVGMSALLTTTMPNMALIILALQEVGVRDQLKIMVGGAPVTAEYATSIGADGFARDAGAAVRLAKSLMEQRV